MIKYHLITRPKAPSFLWIFKFWKIIAGLIITGAVLYLLIYGKMKNEKLKDIYDFQSSISEILNLEIKYMAKRIIPEDDKWIKINEIEGHIYSAYLDTRPEIILEYYQAWREITWGEIRIIGILPMDIKKNQIQCIFKYETNQRKIIYKKKMPASIEVMKDNWNLKYSAVFIICQLSYSWQSNYEIFYNEKQLPESVGVQWKNSNENQINFIDIHYPQQGVEKFHEKFNKFMAVCVPVLHHKFNRALELVEFIEYYKMMGVDHFTFYNSSVTSDVNKVLEFYSIRDPSCSFDILNWTLSSIYVYEQTLRQEGLFAALNDCLYRNTVDNNYRYVGTFDVDEFLVPRKFSNFRDLMNLLDKNLTGLRENSVASFLFRNTYFYTMYEDDKNGQPYLYTRAKTKRLKKPHEGGERSRYIVRGRDVLELGNYNTWKLRDGSLVNKQNYFEEIVVDPEVALLHHYAPCEAEETGCYLKEIVVDLTAQKFTDKLGKRVATICTIIFGNNGCPLPVKRTNGS